MTTSSPPLTDTQALQRVMAGGELRPEDMRALMQRIMAGETADIMTAALLIGLRTKPESVAEITAAASVMRALAIPVDVPDRQHLVDVCGTGGDGTQTFNVSTATMFVAAAAGARVAKHGGRSVSSNSGSADVLEALGACITLSPSQITQCLVHTGVGFMFAPQHHPAMKRVAPVRKVLGVRTLFNILGPLSNPAAAPHQLMGVFHPDLIPLQVRTLQNLGSQHVMVVHGRDGLDELTLGGETLVGELIHGQVREYVVHPSEVGLSTCDPQTLKALNTQASVACIQRALANEAGPVRDIVLLNAGAALYCADVATTLNEGVERAREVVANGQAAERLKTFISFTQSMAQHNMPDPKS